MKTFVVIRTDYPMEVHALGCADLTRKRLSTDWKIEGDTVDAAVAAETKHLNSEFDDEYAQSDLFRILPCCRK